MNHILLANQTTKEIVPTLIFSSPKTPIKVGHSGQNHLFAYVSMYFRRIYHFSEKLDRFCYKVGIQGTFDR